MEQRILGKTGLRVSVLGFGGAEIGFEKPDMTAVSRLLNAALDAGLTVLDTAECYGAGTDDTSSEHLIGQTVAHRRGEFVLLTKCGHASGISEPDWSPTLLRQSIDRSLKRLRTDALDVLQLHSCGADTLRQGDVIAVLQDARDAGKTRFIGYSGDNDAARFAVESGAFDTLQTSVNIADQAAIGTIERAFEKGMGVLAKRPLANAAWRWQTEAEAWDYHKAYWARLQTLAYPFLTGDAHTISRTALQFTLSVPGVHTAIVGTKNPDRWSANAALLAHGATLSPSDYAAIRARFDAASDGAWAGET